MVNSQTHELAEKLDQELPELVLIDVPIPRIVSEISIGGDVPIGLEAVKNESRQNVNFTLVQGTVRQSLDLIVATFPKYRWAIVDGVVNIFPIEKHESILDLNIREYETTARTPFALRVSIAKIPEVKRFAKRRNIRIFTLEVGSLNGTITPKGFSSKYRNLSMRQILNDLCKKTTNKYWVLTEDDTKDKLMMIYL